MKKTLSTLPQKNPLHWLIVEDALRDRSGHWFEYISTFWGGLRQLGDEVTILADAEAQPFILENLKAIPVLPPSIWHRMSDGSNPLIRYLRLPVHAWQTVRVMEEFLSQNSEYDVIFVPTVLVHHLLAWIWLIKRGILGKQTRVILFFINAPVTYDVTNGTYHWTKAITTKLLRFLLKVLAPEVQKKKVIFGAEPYLMQKALSQLSRLPFTYFPQPVEPAAGQPSQSSLSENKLVMGSYGEARHEKGNDILYRGISEFNQLYPDSDIQFILHCLDGFEAERALLADSPNVVWLTNYLEPGEYLQYLLKTNIMLLPYRISSYSLRGSRVVSEAIVNGIPVIATEGTTLADQARKFGSVVECKNEDPVSLAHAIHYGVTHYEELKAQSQASVLNAQAHFSVKYFKECLLN